MTLSHPLLSRLAVKIFDTLLCLEQVIIPDTFKITLVLIPLLFPYLDTFHKKKSWKRQAKKSQKKGTDAKCLLMKSTVEAFQLQVTMLSEAQPLHRNCGINGVGGVKKRGYRHGFWGGGKVKSCKKTEFLPFLFVFFLIEQQKVLGR